MNEQEAIAELVAEITDSLSEGIAQEINEATGIELELLESMAIDKPEIFALLTLGVGVVTGQTEMASRPEGTPRNIPEFMESRGISTKAAGEELLLAMTSFLMAEMHMAGRAGTIEKERDYGLGSIKVTVYSENTDLPTTH